MEGSPFQRALSRLDDVAGHAEIPAETLQRLRHPSSF